jgi:hypothetical protein
MLELSLHPVVDELKPIDQKSLDVIADKFQARYVGYRLRNFSDVRKPKLDVANLTVSTQELARTIGAAVIGDIQLQEKILPMLRAQDANVLAERSSKVESVELEALLSFTHMQGVSEVRSCEVAETTSAIFLGRGFERVVSPESAGWAMKRLGLPIGRIDSTGNGLKLTTATRRLVHELAERYGIIAMRAKFKPGCPYCEELKHKFGQRNEDTVA